MVEEDAGPLGEPTPKKEHTSEHVDMLDAVVCESSECNGEHPTTLFNNLGIEGLDL